MFKSGNMFLVDGVICILAQCGNHKVALISLVCGNRWTDPVDVENSGEITEQEFIRILGPNNPTCKQIMVDDRKAELVSKLRSYNQRELDFLDEDLTHGDWVETELTGVANV